MATIPYEKKPEQIRKLRRMNNEFIHWQKAHIQAWDNCQWDAAKVALKEANLAHARLVAYCNTLAGWQEKGVPTDGWAS